MSIIRESDGDLFAYHFDAEIICVTTNRVGVSGKGVALAAKRRYPDEFERNYKLYCQRKEWGCQSLYFDEASLTHVVNLDTKHHWAPPSTMKIVRESLLSLFDFAQANSCRWIAMSPPGCGSGGLSWINQVKPLLQSVLDDHAGDFDVMVCFKGSVRT